MLSIVESHKIAVSKEAVAKFNAQWPCSELSSSRGYWFEYDSDGYLVDTDVPEREDGQAARVLSVDCQKYLFDGITPSWM